MTQIGAIRFQFSDRAMPVFKKSWFVPIFLFFLPFTLLIEFDLVGRLFLADIIAIAAFPFIVMFRRRSFDQRTRRALILLIAWLSAQILTDFIRGTPVYDLARGWSKLGITFIYFFIFSVLLVDQPSRARALLAGVGGTMLLGAIIAYAPGNPLMLWKMGGVTGLMLFLLALAAGASRYRLASIILIAGALLALYYNSRSSALLCFTSAFFLIGAIFFSGQRRKHGRLRKVSLRTFLLLMVGGCIAILAVFELYSFVVQSGWLGQDALNKFMVQRGDRGPIGLLVCGRAELIASLQAIADSPIWGHGSWARDMSYRFGINQQLAAYGCPWSENVILQDDIIPSHSILFGAWVEAGIMGALFWVFVAYLVIQFLGLVWRNHSVLAPLLVFVAVILIWDILFSPFGASRRLTMMAMAAALLQAVRLYGTSPIFKRYFS